MAAKSILFTPGPLMTTDAVKAAMLTDYGSRDRRFMDAVKFIREETLRVLHLDPSEWVTILQQGAGTMAIEAAISTVFPRDGKGKYLLLNSGKYSERQSDIVKRLKFPLVTLKSGEGEEIDFVKLEAILKENTDITTVGYVHHETSTGMAYPAEQIGRLVRKYVPNAVIIADGMSSLGGIAVDIPAACDIIVTSANKCFHGVPGFAIVVARRKVIAGCKGRSRSSTLDLYTQLASFDKSGQFVITPPVHTVMAFKVALEEYVRDGGLEGRRKLYKTKADVVIQRGEAMGFTLFLKDRTRPSFGNIAIAFNMPTDPKWNFKKFYTYLNDKGYVIYPGKASHAETFRIGIIGSTTVQQTEQLMQCCSDALASLGIQKLSPMSKL